MHGDALEMSVDRGQEADYLYVLALVEHALAERVEGPGTVFAAAPREKDFPFQGDSYSTEL
jgi:hypothetical protein